MLQRGDRVITAVSGGPDSVCMLDIMADLKGDFDIEIVVAHFEHGLRPQIDGYETGFVARLAESYGFPFVVQRAEDTGKNGGGIEEKAREERYDFLERVRRQYAAQKVAMGHSLDDQAETLIMRLLRGSGATGLAGIPPVRDGMIIRPLIGLRRAEIDAYVECKGLDTLTDESNTDTRYLRNRIRMELLPRMEDYQPRIARICAQTSKILRQDEEFIHNSAEEWLDARAIAGERGDIHLPLKTFRPLAPALKTRVVRCAVMRASGTLRRLGSRHVESILRVAESEKPQSGINLPFGLMASRSYGTLVFSKADSSGEEDRFRWIEGPGVFDFKEMGGRFVVEELRRENLQETRTPPHVAQLDGDRLGYPLGLRRFRDGDNFIPLGMRGRKKIKDLFIDLKVPNRIRKSVPILTKDNDILWVCGFRIVDGFKVTPKTRKVLRITWKDSASILAGWIEKKHL